MAKTITYEESANLLFQRGAELTSAEIATQFGLPIKAARKLISRMLRKGLIEPTTASYGPKYRTTEGRRPQSSMTMIQYASTFGFTSIFDYALRGGDREIWSRRT